MWVRRAEMRRLLELVRELKARIARLEGELASERELARGREFQWADRVLTASGRYALVPEGKKATGPPKPPPLTAYEEARLLALRKAAVEAGRSPAEADQLFYAQRNGEAVEVPQPDEPYILPT